MIAPLGIRDVVELPSSSTCERCGQQFVGQHPCPYRGPNAPPAADPRWRPAREMSPAQQRAQLAANVARCRAAITQLVARVDELAQREPSAPAWPQKPQERIPPSVAQRVDELAFGLHELVAER